MSEKNKLNLHTGNGSNRPSTDFYPTPPEVTEALMDFLLPYLPKTTIWEPAAGEGDMVEVLSKYGDVLATDLSTGYDYLATPVPGGTGAIITNPPFKLAEKFILKAVREAPVVAMLLKTQYWHARSRYDLFQEHPPSFVLPLTWRPNFLFKTGLGGSPTMDVAWSVWIKGVPGTQYKPLKKRT